jgi:L-fuconolactonase
MPGTIIDTHLHLWDPGLLRYSWLDDIPLLNRSYLLDDYRTETSGLAIEQMIFVQCEVDTDLYLEEVAWVTDLAGIDNRIAGIVPWAPLELGGEADEVVAQLAENRLVKGIRRIVQFEADAQFCLQPGFVRGVRNLANHGLHFEVCLKGDEQFANCIELVEKCPEVGFLLNHIGKPYIVNGNRRPWSDHLQRFASLPNTWCKVSGLANEADMTSWTDDDLQPYLATVFEAFGWDRVMFGGDWPVALLATDYHRWVNALERQALAWGASQAELDRLFAENARQFYRLGPTS